MKDYIETILFALIVSVITGAVVFSAYVGYEAKKTAERNAQAVQQIASFLNNAIEGNDG